MINFYFTYIAVPMHLFFILIFFRFSFKRQGMKVTATAELVLDYAFARCGFYAAVAGLLFSICFLLLKHFIGS